MLEVLVYKKNGTFRAAIDKVIFYDKSEKLLLGVVEQYVYNVGDYEAVAFYREKENYPFSVTAFARDNG